MVTRVFLHRGDRWCELVSAEPGGWITTVCGDAIPYSLVLVCTSDPGELGCARCRTACAATGGADLDDDDALGPDSAAIASALDDHEDLLGDDCASAFDHLSDLRDADFGESLGDHERRRDTGGGGR